MTPFDRHNISHLSASSLNLFVAQPSLWMASYLLKRRTGVGPAAHRGTAIECGVEAGLFDPHMPVAEAQKLAEAKFHTLTRFSADARIEKERELVAPSVEVALAELRQYGVPEKPENGRQHKIEVELGEGLPPAWGFLDFKFQDHGITVDLKTSSRVPSEISVPHSRQGAIYWKHLGNHQIRFAYASGKRMAVYALEEPAIHFAECVKIARAIERLLSLSDDGEKLTRALYPDATSFYWGDASAQSLAREIWAD